MDKRTLATFKRIEPHFQTFLDLSRKTGIPLDLAVAVAFVEQQQYTLHNAVVALKALKNRLCRVPSFNAVVGQLLPPVSVGLCHIKEFTAQRAVAWADGHLDPADIGRMAWDDTASIRVLFGVLVAHKNRWADHFDLARRPDIWATLFNICDFGRIVPHGNPSPGGSELPLWIGGTLLPELPFGSRVVIVMNSWDLDVFKKSQNVDTLLECV